MTVDMGQIWPLIWGVALTIVAVTAVAMLAARPGHKDQP